MYAWWELIVWQFDDWCICWYTCTSIHMWHCQWEPKLWYDAEVLGHMRIELIDCNTKTLGCQRLGGMTDEVNTIACWVGRVYMHHVVGLHDRRGQHGYMLGQMCLYAPYYWVAWQMRSTQLHIGLDISIYTIEIGRHDKRGQHDCLLDRMCLSAPIWKYELLINKLAMCEFLSCEMKLEWCYKLC